MNSAKELNQAHQNAAFEKAKQKVIAVLENDPFGLTVSQLMTKCQLSVKTVKQVLGGDEFKKDDELYTLVNHITPDLSQNKQQAISVPTPNQHDVTCKSDTQPKKPTYIQRMVKMFRDYPNGISKNDALYILGGSADMFATMLKDVRRYHFAVELVKQSDGEKLYIPQFNNPEQTLPDQLETVPVTPIDLPIVEQEVDQNLPIQPETVPVTADALPNTDEAILHKNESETPNPEYFEHKNEYLPDLVAVNDIEKTALLECKNMVQTQTFQKSEVYLDLDQINILLTQLFDLNDVKWCTTGARVDGVHLSKVQAI